MKPWKLQKFAGDVVHDLRSRNLLLPMVALLIAIVAVPILLKSNSDSGSGVVASTDTSTRAAGPGDAAVVAYNPGVRNYKQRLKDTAKDPFVQQFRSAPHTSTSSGNPVLQATVPSNVSTGVGGGTTNSGGSGTTGGGGGGKTKPGKVTEKTKYFWWVSDVQVGEAGTQPPTISNVQPFQFLPSQDKPVLTYMGTVGGNQAIFLVSKDVSSIGGDGTCFPSVDACQLLGVNAGKGADLIYAPDGKTYHVQVLAVRRVTSSKPPSF